MNLSKTKTKMKIQDINERIKNFDEVMLGYNKEEAILEASRCLQCKNPTCVKGCPANNNIPAFIMAIKENNCQLASEILNKTSCLSAICGRVCAQENQCEGNCIRSKNGEPVNIGALERYVADNYPKSVKETFKNNFSIGIIGSGPASIACAYDLLNMNYNVTMYEKESVLGGVLTYGIPSFVLPKKVVNEKFEELKTMGLNIVLNTEVGKDITLSELKEKHNAIFIANGAVKGKMMNIEGENLNGVYDANDYLKKVNVYNEHLNEKSIISKAKNVVVVGGGNVAIDAARVAKRINNANVSIVYRRSFKEMPARNDEVIRAQEENINFLFLTNPIKIIGNEKVNEIECVRMELKEADESGRARPQVILNSNFKIKADIVIMAISSSVDFSLFENLNTSKWNTLIIDENQMTSDNKVFAGGDNVNGPATVVLAMKDGKKAAESIDKMLKKASFEKK